MGALRFVEGTPTQPETHEVIPDDVLDYFKNAQRYATWNVMKNNSWGCGFNGGCTLRTSKKRWT